jgi:hypothetical protein
MSHHISWPKDSRPVQIEVADGVDEVFQKGYITAHIKAQLTRRVGLMLDADSDPAARYERIRSRCIELFPDLPEQLPQSGLVTTNEDKKRLGVWIMPDNSSSGYLESFLRFLVPTEFEPLWNLAINSVTEARTLGAACRSVDIPKANLHTWLAWQEEPGRPFGVALTAKILDPFAPNAGPFVTWFRDLYEL